MINLEYANAYSEVLEILQYISREDYNKIPKKQIELFEKNANPNHNFVYNPLKTLNEQDALKITKGIISILFRDYWATDIQREKIIAKQNYARQILEEEKREKYNPNNIFNNEKEIKNVIKEEKALVEIKNEKWYEKVLFF